MVEQLSPLGAAFEPGLRGNAANGVGVLLSEPQPGSIVQMAAWPGCEAALLAAIARATGLKLGLEPGAGIAEKTRAAFGIAPGRFLLIDEEEGLADQLLKATGPEIGSVTDLSHGRTAIRLKGPRADWVLSKLFAVDFSAAGLGIGNAVSTNHHDVFAQIQRSGPDQFDIYVFRSFARSFWKTLGHAAEETGYEVR
jgi:heterotetrameric sarcosine oxidase gamma subunit